MTETIKEAITKAFVGNVEIEILDPRQDGIHLEAIVISEAFDKMSLLKRHQKVMQALKTQFETSLHALALKTYTPHEWETKQKG